MCDMMIHDELINIEEFICPYCDQLLITCDKVDDLCCDGQQIEDLNGIMTCISCGQVNGYVNDTGFIDYYENLHKIKRKSVYNRKYHIENKLNSFIYYRKIELTFDQRNRIYKVFKEIDNILKYVNKKDRKRIISVNYLLRMILKMMKLSYDNIPVTKSVRTHSY